MRTFGALLILAPLACAARTPPAATLSSPANCPERVVATVTNPRAVMYDVYYRDPARPETIIGEVSPGSTVTFPLPGEGRGRVYAKRPPGDLTPERAAHPGSPLPEIRIRVHCAGT